MIIRSIAIGAIWLTLLISKPSFALGKSGHQIVCQLAFEHLSPAKQTQITNLLQAIPLEHQNLINRYNYQKQGQIISFADACTWADAVKRLEEFTQYNAWHYMNVPRDHKKIIAQDCDKNCLPQAILTHQKTLMTSSSKDLWPQTQALLFLGHWLGDIHQPLHISFADDLGGNKVKFAHLETKCSNLHWYWDDCILYLGKNTQAQWLVLLRKAWQKASQPTWQAAQVWQWADESFQLVKSPSFKYCQQTKQGHCSAPTQTIKLPQGYLAQYQVVMEQRLLQAAQRLTKLLEVSL